MKILRHNEGPRRRESGSPRNGSVLVIVLWIVFGLVSITLYFGNSMTFELRASDNRVAGIESELAIEGGRRYVSLMLSNLLQSGNVPEPKNYQCESVPVGNARFWLIGRTNIDNTQVNALAYGLVDEAGKLNLNTASSNMLYMLPRMTPELVNSILAWRSTNTSSSTGGAESDTYSRLQPPYLCKDAPFETVNELRLVYGMDMELLYGEDANMNGIMDSNENDGETLLPRDDQNGRLDPGLLEYLTIYTSEPTTTTNGTARCDVSNVQGITSLRTNMMQVFGQQRGDQILQQAGLLGPGQNGQPRANAAITCPLQFYIASGMTPTEFETIEPMLRGARIEGLINVNTASTAVLACLPGLEDGKAQQLTNYRQSSAQNRNSISWLPNVLDATTANSIGQYITGKTYQFTADLAAVGHNGRGYRRTRFVFDLSQAAPKVIYREDLSHLGWALGKQVRDRWLLAKSTP